MMPEYGHHWEPLVGPCAMPITYAFGDIHGSLDKLKSLISLCRGDADGRETILVFLGDYIDRGPESAGVVRFVLSLPEEGPERVIALKGNHEAWALGILDGLMPPASWLLNGGAATLQSYGVGNMAGLPRADLSIGCARCR